MEIQAGRGVISADGFETFKEDINRFEVQGSLKRGIIFADDFGTLKGDLNRFDLQGC